VNLKENIQLALAGLWAGKMRALLTMLGIIIGIGAVIAIVTVGNTLTQQVTQSMSELGVNNIQVSMRWEGVSEYRVREESDFITEDMIDEMSERLGGRIAATSISQTVGGGQARDGRRYANTSIIGVSHGYRVANNIEMITGRFLSQRDGQSGRRVAVISDVMARRLFSGADPLGEEIKVYTQTDIKVYTVVGVYEHVQGIMGMMAPASEDDLSTDVYIPVSTAISEIGGIEGYLNFMAVAAPGENIEALMNDIESLFNDVFYARNPNWGVRTFSMESMIAQFTTMMTGMSVAIAIIAAISLLVGGIGVMNIMLVSVTERTREIGTRKALGARNSAIRIQFIVESIIICTIGGIIGILLGIALGTVGSAILQSIMMVDLSSGGGVAVPVPAVILAVVFSMAIGIFFGYYPANKAAKLDPIDALRYE